MIERHAVIVDVISQSDGDNNISRKVLCSLLDARDARPFERPQWHPAEQFEFDSCLTPIGLKDLKKGVHLRVRVSFNEGQPCNVVLTELYKEIESFTVPPMPDAPRRLGARAQLYPGCEIVLSQSLIPLNLFKDGVDLIGSRLCIEIDLLPAHVRRHGESRAAFDARRQRARKLERLQKLQQDARMAKPEELNGVLARVVAEMIREQEFTV